MLEFQGHHLIHDEPTRWDSSFQMVDRFLEQQEAVCAVLTKPENRKKRHLVPRDKDIEALEVVQAVLKPISVYTDALSGEKHTSLSSVLPLCWKIFDCLTIKTGPTGDSKLACEMKEKIAEDLRQRYEPGGLQLLLNTAAYLDPRFKLSFVNLREEVKQSLENVLLTEAPIPQPPSSEAQQPPKKKIASLKGLLSTIQGEKKSHDDVLEEIPSVGVQKEFAIYDKMPELSAEEDPLKWWERHEEMLPHLAHLAKKYLCIAASSVASERVFSTSGFICSPTRARLTEEHIDMLVFLAQNLKLEK